MSWISTTPTKHIINIDSLTIYSKTGNLSEYNLILNQFGDYTDMVTFDNFESLPMVCSSYVVSITWNSSTFQILNGVVIKNSVKTYQRHPIYMSALKHEDLNYLTATIWYESLPASDSDFSRLFIALKKTRNGRTTLVISEMSKEGSKAVDSSCINFDKLVKSGIITNIACEFYPRLSNDNVHQMQYVQDAIKCIGQISISFN